jgi:hypothetical protein
MDKNMAAGREQLQVGMASDAEIDSAAERHGDYVKPPLSQGFFSFGKKIR